MKKALVVLFCVVMCGATVFAQNNDDHKKAEFFAGYSHIERDPSRTNHIGLNGFEAAGVYNFSRYFGIKGDFSAAFERRRIPFVAGAGNSGTLDSHDRLLDFLGGIQIKDNAKKGRFKPFAHALVGVGQTRLVNDNFQCTLSCAAFSSNSTSKTGLAFAFGGGLDVRMNDRIQLRVVQVDYDPVKGIFGTQQNIRFGAGIVF